jgi:hypothetical protein
LTRCRVGYLPRHILKHKKAYDGRAAQIVEFLALSESTSDKAKSHRNAGVCRAVLLELDRLPDSDERKKRNSESGKSPELSKKQKQSKANYQPSYLAAIAASVFSIGVEKKSLPLQFTG